MVSLNFLTSWMPTSLQHVATPTVPTTLFEVKDAVSSSLFSVAMMTLYQETYHSASQGELKTDHWQPVRVPLVNWTVSLPPINFKYTTMQLVAGMFYPMQVFFTAMQWKQFGAQLVSKVADLRWYQSGNGEESTKVLHTARLEAAKERQQVVEKTFWSQQQPELSEASLGVLWAIKAEMLRRFAMEGDKPQVRQAIVTASKGVITDDVAGKLLGRLKTIQQKPEFAAFLAIKGQHESEIAGLVPSQALSALPSSTELVIKQQRRRFFPALGTTLQGLIRPAIGTIGTVVLLAMSKIGRGVELADSMLNTTTNVFTDAHGKTIHVDQEAVDLCREPSWTPVQAKYCPSLLKEYHGLQVGKLVDAQMMCDTVAAKSWLQSESWLAWGVRGLHTGVSKLEAVLDFVEPWLPHFIFGQQVFADLKTEGVKQLSDNLPYYLAAASWQGVIPTMVTSAVGSVAQSCGLFTTWDSSTVGRGILGVVPVVGAIASKFFRAPRRGKSTEEEVVEASGKALSKVVFPSLMSLMAQQQYQLVFKPLLRGWNALIGTAERGWDCHMINVVTPKEGICPS